MLSIGRALMTHPELIILDEATEGLAPLIVSAIWRVLAEIRSSGIATLIVDRNYRKVLAQSDHALVLQKGQVVLRGSAAEVAQSAALVGYLGVWVDRMGLVPSSAAPMIRAADSATLALRARPLTCI